MIAAAAIVAACSWDRPGADPFMGNVVEAVDRYQDIPPATRAVLKKRIAARQYDELATIRRDSIQGTHRYTNLRDMHFGDGKICRSVTRDRWAGSTQERGLVYCEAEHCLIVPTVCRNVSRVTRLAPPRPPIEIPGGTELTRQIFTPIPLVEIPVLTIEDPPVQFEPPARPRALFVPSFESVVGRTPFVADPPAQVTPPTIKPAEPIPEPSTWVLILSGIASMMWLRRR